MSNFLLVDDEPLALRDLAAVLREAGGPSDPVMFQFPSKALAWAREHRVDVAFLDIEMPGMGGLELARALKELQPEVRIVFMTSYEQYALEAFSLHATGYLLKPARVQDVRRELMYIFGEKVLDGLDVEAAGRSLFIKRSDSKELLARFVSGHEVSAGARSLKLRGSRGELFAIDPDAVYSVEASGKRSILHTAEGDFEAPYLLSEVESKLPGQFMRVHRSYVINCDHMVSLDASGVTLVDGTTIPVPAKRRAMLRRFFECS